MRGGVLDGLLQVGGDRVHRRDVALVPVDEDEGVHVERGQLLAQVGEVGLEHLPPQGDGAGMAGMDGGHPVLTTGDHQCVESFGEGHRHQGGGDGVGAVGEVGTVLFHTPERDHRHAAASDEFAHVGRGEVVDRS